MATSRTAIGPVQPLTLTVEQTAVVLGVARSTAYELVRTGDVEGIRLRRRIVVPVAHLAERLGVTAAEVWSVLQPSPPSPPAPQARRPAHCGPSRRRDDPTLF